MRHPELFAIKDIAVAEARRAAIGVYFCDRPSSGENASREGVVIEPNLPRINC
jgi:hypothetical protein